MRVFVCLFLVSVLGCSLAEGRVVTKCDLKKEFDNRTEGEWPKGLTGLSLAKLICHVEKASEFNTSAVNQLIPSHLRRRRRNVDESEGLSGLAKMRGSFSSVDLHQRKKRSSEPDSSSEEEEEQWTLYGLFQLSDHLVCSDGATPSPDRICNVTCSALVDDDIEDDISCVFNIISKVINGGFAMGHKPEFWRMVRLLFQPECDNETAEHYFAECKDQ
ncbi:Alpha-lactalbumin [Dissostichus eleginoides]|uniref:lysozyme n=1 Tax=Dissostichus eleginoides TaxID=100907 RepID=A0AAD9BRA6_DISEL|nr:Alpha-lactalbumin [Dissostichus eleginoides]